MDVFTHRDWPFYKLDVEKSWGFIDIDNLNKIKIAFLDTGCNIEHHYLKKLNITCINSLGNIVKGDMLGHGTFFSGILGQYININGKANPNIISIQLGNNGQISIEDICNGINKAIDLNVDVLNISACNLSYNPKIAKLIANAIRKRIIVISPSGNNLIEEFTYPASLDTVISCASINSNLTLANHSNFNELINVCAPGENLTGPMDRLHSNKLNLNIDSNGLTKTSGTSFAAAIVTALAALVKSKHKDIDKSHFDVLLKNALKQECYIRTSNGNLIRKKIVNFYEVLKWIVKNEIEDEIIHQKNSLYWYITNFKDSNIKGVWNAQIYDAFGNKINNIKGKVKITLYKFNKEKDNDLKLVIEEYIENGSINWSLNYNIPGTYYLTIIDDKCRVIKGIAFGNIYPPQPKLKFIKKEENYIKVDFNCDFKNETLYYSFNEDIIDIDTKKECGNGTYIYNGTIKAPLDIKKINAVIFSNELFSDICTFNISD